ncbi:MAG: dihydroorotate dehydrogenase electron transfer subunit [Clostridiales bacterium]|nr:dihydroorotate dehydrogenase electron transfer subunit [Clostridiales bacterium]
MTFTIQTNTALTASVWKMVLEGDTSAITKPGQFVQLQLPGFYLRRPISVCDWDDKTLTLVYKVVGEGTQAMADMKPGTALDVLTGLGNGFDVDACGDAPLLIGGGVGLPPMIALCRVLTDMGKHPTVLAGFNTSDEVFLKDAVDAIGAPFVLATMDGSAGVKGLVTDAMKDLTFTDVCACGPLPMLRAVYDAAEVPGQFSFEERMGCGFGACMGCTVKVKGGYKRICKDGPVLNRDEIIWEA